ncbi:MAG TPA: DNA translocase FtsK 4TM domain-containing protein, partial [Thermoanaerobaculia bacterium]|nr:DNA translocase FtsK 4TM domain-containing protein [Thermoanaerobaculia bacterium]
MAGVMELLQFAKSRRGGELIGILVLAAGLTLGAALVTYHPDDSSAFYTSTNSTIANAIGYYGATIAWIFAGFFGLASLLFPAALVIIGWQRFWGRELEFFQTKLIGSITLITATPPLLELALGKIWIRGALLASGGYLGQQMDLAATTNLNRGGAAILFGTMFLVGLLLATRMSLAALFLALRDRLAALGRALSLQWSRVTERRRKEKMKEAIVRKHRDSAEGAPLRLVESVAGATPAAGPVVREVRGAGRFQIRKVTKADLRKAAEALAQQETHDPFALYAGSSTAAPVMDEMEGAGFEEPLFLNPHPRPRPQVPRPATRKPRDTRREPRRGNDLLPPVSLLIAGPKQDQIGDEIHRKYLEVGRLIEERCREFSVEGEVTAYHPGPVVTTFEFKPSAGVKYAKVVNLGDDLALALKAESIRIERISGSSTVGIEVPNRNREAILLHDTIDTDVFAQSSTLLTMALGKDIHGDPVVTDLGRMPHLLVAGATGAGKSVGLNSMIISMLYKALPRQLRMLMIDPKMVELKIYEDIPHLLHPIVTDPKLASNALIWVVSEMENRYRTLAECGVRNIDQYNALLKDPEALHRARKVPEDGAPSPDP